MGKERTQMVLVLFTVLIRFLGLYDLPQTMAGAARDPTPTVIVVGAGMSGISAAKTFSDAGIKNFLILEGTNRIGGRIKKTNFAGITVELGANWVEGVNGDEINPIWTMVNKIGLKTYYSDFNHLANHTYKQMGGVYEKSVAQQGYSAANRLSTSSQKLSVSLSRRRQTDMSILASQRLKNHVPSTPIEMAIDYYTYDYEFDSRGYESVVHYVAKQFLTTDEAGDIVDPRLVLNKAVTEIQYSKSGVVVKTEDGSVYEAEYVMVSASIGVLQTTLIDFVPDLPAWKLLAIYQFDMSIYTKIFLKFPYKFWPTGNGTEFFIHAHEKRGYYTMWQQLENEFPGANCLLVTVTDDESRRIEQQPDSETLAEIMDVLRNMFGQNIPDATDILVPKWWSDRFYKGTFSNWPIGVDQYEYDQIRAPVGRVYFTGEHTSQHYNGYVHGAYLAGIDSANILIKYTKRKKHNYKIKPKGSLVTFGTPFINTRLFNNLTKIT
ncbi:polyamine oxidase-like [Papaver somniferum]|uniref:polyamine oxidase-like n=1 Tax=Papaver somniferum TaxID=3469 RepID=UPI000E6F94D3|nr:polyamine oxidase-like [Papaver somniferum]